MAVSSATGLTSEVIGGVRVRYWNPERSVEGAPARRPDNFGDLLGPRIVTGMLQRLGIQRDTRSGAGLLSIGSVLHFAELGDVVWGSGINGKEWSKTSSIPPIDIRSVRGPHTRKLLADNGHDVPAVYGDPALLIPSLMPDLASLARGPRSRQVTIVPNLNDLDPDDDDPRIIRPTADLDTVLTAIATSELVVGSSLHAIIVAEALGVPARAVRSTREHHFKYVDYYAGTGRRLVPIAQTTREAIDMGGADRGQYDLGAIAAAFPADLWSGEREASVPGRVRSPERWELDTSERWAANQYGAPPANDSREAYRSSVIGGLLSSVSALDRHEVEEVLKLEAAVRPAAEPEWSTQREEDMASAVRRHDLVEIRALAQRHVRGSGAEVTSIRVDGDRMSVEGRTWRDNGDDVSAIELATWNEESGASTCSAVHVAGAPIDSVWEWRHTTPLSRLDSVGTWVFAIRFRLADGNTEDLKLRYSPRMGRVSGAVPLGVTLSSVAGGRFFFVERS